jgi:hypothetical protein
MPQAMRQAIGRSDVHANVSAQVLDWDSPGNFQTWRPPTKGDAFF